MLSAQRVASLAVQAGFKVWKDGRISAGDGMVSGAASQSVARLIELVLERAGELLAEQRQGLTFEQAAERFGWGDVELTHARDSMDCNYGDECVIPLANGREIRCPSGESACEYVRVTEAGFELMFWHASEWCAAPEEVVGAFLGLARAPHLDELRAMAAA